MVHHIRTVNICRHINWLISVTASRNSVITFISEYSDLQHVLYALKSVPTLCAASSAARSINKELAKDTESNLAVLFPVADVNHAAKKVFWSDDFLFFLFSSLGALHITQGGSL